MEKSAKKYIPLFLILALLLALGACSERPEPPETPPATEPPVVETDPPETPPPATESPAVETDPQETPPPAPVPPDLIEQPRVENDFFADAALMGNSMARGLELWGGIPTIDYFGINSASVATVTKTKNFTLRDGTPCTQLEALCQKQYGKIYLLYGINESGYSTEGFIRLYGEMLDALVKREPDAEIYILSLCPVTEKKSTTDATYTEERVLELNAALHALAEERGFWYVDNVEALAGEDGYLPEDYARDDGIHLLEDKYPLWAEYLRTHYAPPAEEPGTETA